MKEEYVEGVFVDSEFSMELGAPYGCSDAYTVEAHLKTHPSGSITFASFDEMEEFSRHLSDYVEKCKPIGEK